MTMNIDAKATIAGLPILRVRKLVRDLLGSDYWSQELVEERLAPLPKRAVAKVIAELHALGYIARPRHDPAPKVVGGWWVVADPAGLRFANASAAGRISRATADRAVADFLDRVHQANANPDFLYRVTRAAVFGSYLTDAERLGDVDLVITLTRVPDWTEQRWLDRVHASERRFSNIVARYSWDRDEVYLFLKARSRVLSLHRAGESKVVDTAVQRVLFEAPLAQPIPPR